MPLCRVCKDIDLSALTVHGRPRSWELNPPSQGFPSSYDLFYHESPDTNAIIPHYDTIEELKSSAATCELCQLIALCVNETLTQFRIAQELDFAYELSGYEFFLSPRPSSDGFQVLGRRADDKLTYYVMGWISFCVDDSKIHLCHLRWILTCFSIRGLTMEQKVRSQVVC